MQVLHDVRLIMNIPCLVCNHVIGVRRSFSGFIIVTLCFIVWIIIFQTQWKSKGWENLLLQIPPEDNLADW